MKIRGVIFAGGEEGEIRWVDPAGRDRGQLVSLTGSHGEDLVLLRGAASKVALEYGFDLEFEIVDSFEPEQRDDAPDPRLSSPEHLRQRRAAGEHLCFFCVHEQICAVQIPLRASTPALIVISGCSQFAPVEVTSG